MCMDTSLVPWLAALLCLEWGEDWRNLEFTFRGVRFISRCTGVIIVLQVYQTHSCPRTFALAICPPGVTLHQVFMLLLSSKSQLIVPSLENFPDHLL